MSDPQITLAIRLLEQAHAAIRREISLQEQFRESSHLRVSLQEPIGTEEQSPRLFAELRSISLAYRYAENASSLIPWRAVTTSSISFLMSAT